MNTFHVDFTEVKQMMLILVQVRAEVDRGDMSRRDLCIKMHEDVSKKLLPLFKDLADMDMLVLWTKAHGGGRRRGHSLVGRLQLGGDRSKRWDSVE